ncbi:MULTISPECIES: VOC family protein [unclassified Arenibacter]|uniref:SMU1112c/YaeR family gloxylase I-like metalloprotein n=1 Tax=unclassified Arenibacter TaxID=2615047 RepID=UPI000E3545DE|nr:MULTISPECIES: VOC family protein [unclassified Arenibacter]MCM4162255.1 VOC family protein [Arenibacter sp. A80]RFT57861.1 VOC family protein [Arenibacter sp. P308M17]
MILNKIHHIAIICSDYKKSKKFYVEDLGLEPLQEIYREDRDSYKLDLAMNGNYIIELFSFPTPPPRSTRPEATGLRHLAFEVDHLTSSLVELSKKGIVAEPVRIDEHNQKKFTFIFDPDNLPIELYQK